MPYAVDPTAPSEYILSTDRDKEDSDSTKTVFDLKVFTENEITATMVDIRTARNYLKKSNITFLNNAVFVQAIIERGLTGWVKLILEDETPISFSIENMKYLMFDYKSELCNAILSVNKISYSEEDSEG